MSGLPTSGLNLQLLWEFPLPSSGVGGVAATDEMVVVSSRNINDNADLFFILDPADGGLIYKHEVPTKGRLDYGNSPRATPIIGTELVIVLGAFGHLSAIDPTEGKLRWQLNFLESIGGRLPTWGYCASPILIDGTLIVQPGALDGAIMALDSGDGQVKWKTPGTKQVGYASPMVMNATQHSQSLVIGCDQNGLVAWSLATGAEKWRIQPETSGEFMVPSPIVIGRDLFWIGESNGLRGFRIRESASLSGPLLFARNPEVLSDTHSPVFLSGAVVSVDEELLALDPANQLTVLDRFRHRSLDGYASILTEDDRALICCTDGTLLLLKLDSGKWHLLAEKQPRRHAADILAQPAWVDGTLYMRCERSLACYRVQNP